MATLAQSLRIIHFSRTGPNPFEGEFYVRGGQFEDFKLTSSAGRIPQDACDAVALAKERMASGAPDAYKQAVEALQSVSTSVVADWWQS